MRGSQWASGLLLMAMGLLVGCQPAQIENPDYESWEEFGVGSSVTLNATLQRGNETRQARIVKTLTHKTDTEAVIRVETDIQSGPRKGEKEVERRVETAKIVAVEHPIRAAAMDCKDWKDTTCKVEGKALASQVAETKIDHVLKKLGETSPRRVTMKFWVSTEIPGGLVKLESKTLSGEPKVTLAVEAASFTVVPQTKTNN